MSDFERFPRPNLDTDADFPAWAEQYRVLAYVLHMSPQQIAEIDLGFDPEAPERWMAFSWAGSIARTFPRVDLESWWKRGRHPA